MPADDLPIFPGDEQVGVAWISTVPGFTPEMAGTQLPPDDDGQGGPAPWVATGFATVAVVGGGPDAYLPVSRPVYQVDLWAVLPGSGDPPWEFARALATAIVLDARERTVPARVLTIIANGVTYPPATVRSAIVVTAPRRIYGDPGDAARYSMDLSLDWVAVGDTIT